MGSSIARLNDDFLKQRRQQSLTDAMYRTSPQPMVMEEDLEDMYGITPLLLNQKRDMSYQDYLARPQISQPVSPTAGLQSIIDRNEAIMNVPVPPVPTPTPSSKPSPSPSSKPTPSLRSLLEPYNLSSYDYRMFTQGREPTQMELRGGDAGGATKQLGEQYADLGKPSFLGFTGDLGATTGRTIRVDSNRGDDVIRRAETYRDVLNSLRRYQSQQGA